MMLPNCLQVLCALLSVHLKVPTLTSSKQGFFTAPQNSCVNPFAQISNGSHLFFSHDESNDTNTEDPLRTVIILCNCHAAYVTTQNTSPKNLLQPTATHIFPPPSHCVPNTML